MPKQTCTSHVWMCMSYHWIPEAIMAACTTWPWSSDLKLQQFKTNSCVYFSLYRLIKNGIFKTAELLQSPKISLQTLHYQGFDHCSNVPSPKLFGLLFQGGNPQPFSRPIHKFAKNESSAHFEKELLLDKSRVVKRSDSKLGYPLVLKLSSYILGGNFSNHLLSYIPGDVFLEK